MKTFITSLVIFIILLTVLIANCIYVCQFSDEFDSIAQKFNEKSMTCAEDTFSELHKLWEKNSFIITMTNDHSRIEEIELGLLKMETAILTQDYVLYSEARLTLLKVKKLLREYDTLSWEGLM